MTNLDEYCKNHFTGYMENPEQDLSFLDFWKEFVAQVKVLGSEKAINTMLIPNLPLVFNQPEKITAEIYQAAAGKIPVIRLCDTGDFENLVTNLVHKGKRPENLSSTGAAFVYGKSTRFIILSQKPYSNVSAKTMGLSEDDWLKKSMEIRLAHECSHFFTKVHYGTAQNHLHDELIADFCGIFAAFGFYRAEYFEYFMGIKGTEGSRIVNYIPSCSPEVLALLKEKASRAARFLEELSRQKDFLSLSPEEKIRRLCETDLLLL